MHIATWASIDASPVSRDTQTFVRQTKLCGQSTSTLHEIDLSPWLHAAMTASAAATVAAEIAIARERGLTRTASVSFDRPSRSDVDRSALLP
jgi:hypothetical protein